MTNPVHPGRMLFVNIPVADLAGQQSVLRRSSGSATTRLSRTTPPPACWLGEDAFVMLLGREKFAGFAKLPIADPTTHTLALVLLQRVISR